MEKAKPWLITTPVGGVTGCKRFPRLPSVGREERSRVPLTARIGTPLPLPPAQWFAAAATSSDLSSPAAEVEVDRKRCEVLAWRLTLGPA